LSKYLREPPRPIVGGGLIGMARGIGTTSGISLMALARPLGTQSSQAGNHGYAGSEQAGPASAVLVVAAAAVTIALASRAGAGASAERPREADPSGADQ
jgi:hypothetical protein